MSTLGTPAERWGRVTSRALTLLAGLILLVACGSPAVPSSPITSSPNATSQETTTAGQAASANPSSSATTGSSTAPQDNVTTVRWLMYYDNVANDRNWQDEIKLFNDTHPHLKLEVIPTTWNDYVPKLQAMIAANTPPDVVALQNEAEFVAKGFVIPLDDLLQHDQIDRARFVPGALEAAYDGKIYGIRHDTAYWMLFYNKDLFDVAGEPYPPPHGYTLDQFMEVACRLSQPAQGHWGMHNLNWLTGILAQQQGLPYLELVDGVPRYRLDDPATLSFYQRVADFINVRNCQPTTDQSASFGNADPFIAGKAAMSFNGNWGFGGIKDQATFAWDVAPLPGLKQPNVGMKIGIVASSPNRAAAWEFVKWLTYEPEATRFRAERGMGQPAIVDPQAQQLFLEGPAAPPGLQAVMQVLNKPDNSFTLLDVPGLAEANNFINPAVDEVMNGLSQAREALPPAVQQANHVLVREWQRLQRP
ncbi:ABC transporter substrate-binding protein [Kallotenue papyrolyticum]|uniref:ABC transporter substrate-binding protein n=1 Tax=Kallotenue papyrolyticum TaxID=1325125 RepID=UPI0005B7BEDF|nr:sugar ABC transporter substrate-binding protein [Kallotenue papyrolyticum]